MEKYEVNFEEIKELEEMELPAGGSGFGCNCLDAAETAKAVAAVAAK